MNTGNKPQNPKCALAKLIPETKDIEEIKHSAWNNQGILVINVNDDRLNWYERQLVKQLGEKIYGVE